MPTSTAFTFPRIYAYPPFYTLQPNSSTLQDQLARWSSLIQSYCWHQRLFKLALSDALDTELFYNRRMGRRLKAGDARRVLEFMRDAEGRAELVGGGGGGAGTTGKGGGGGARGDVWLIWWRTAEEWAEIIESWITETGQKNTVLTLYELTEGDATRGTEFHGMDSEMLQRALAVLVKRAKAQVFGSEDQLGVKFF